MKWARDISRKEIDNFVQTYIIYLKVRNAEEVCASYSRRWKEVQRPWEGSTAEASNRSLSKPFLAETVGT